jgi:hypothetical protein
MPSLVKKIVATATVITCAVWMMGPSVAQAVTAEELQAQIDALLAQLATLQAQLSALQGGAPAVTGCTITSFDRNLSQGMSGDDVNCLQIVLNSASDTQLAASGVGSPGNETSYFGPLTKAAVIKFQEKYASEILASWGLASGTGFVGSTTRAKLNSILGEGGIVIPPVPGAGLTVTLAADNPASGTIVASTTAELAKFTFTNGESTEVKVTTLKITRTGISSDAALPALYLFDGYTRIGDEGTLSSGVATFNMASGLFAVSAGGSKTVSVRADIAGGSTYAGQTVGVKIASAADVTAVGSTITVNGTFPVSGNLMGIANAGNNLGTATLGTVNPSGDVNIEATNDFVAWQATLQIVTQDAQLEYLRLTQIGSISASDLSNVRLDISGTQVATGQLTAGVVGQDLVFDLSASPIQFTKGQTKTLTVYVDIVGGASKTMKLGLEKRVDIFVKDLAYNSYVIISGTIPARSGTQTITQGTVTITRASDSPSGNVVNTASNVSLAKFDIKANGEEVKINSLRIKIYTTDTTTTPYSLRNGILLLDGVQVGGTAQILASTSSSATGTYTTFNIYQKIGAGVTKTLEVKADIYGCNSSACSSNVLSDNYAVTAQMIGGDLLDNAQGMASLAMIDAPASTTPIPGNALTVGSGSLSLVVNTAYGNQSVSAGSDTRIGSYKLTTGAYDTVNISAFTVGITTSSGMSLGDLSNLYLKYDSAVSSVKGSVGASNVFSVVKTLAPSKTLSIDVWCTLGTSASGTVVTSLAVTATKATDGSDVSITSAVTGQQITTATGLISVAVASDTPDAAIVNGLSTDVLLAKFDFSALYENFTVNTMQITATTSATTSSKSATTTDDYLSVYLKYKDAAGLEITSDPVPFSGTNATFTNLTAHVPNGGTGKVSVYGNMNAVAASGYADSGDGPQLGLTYYKASSGSQPTYSATSSLWGNQMLLYKTAPTVGVRAGITSGPLVNGVNDIYAVTISANAKGDAGLKKITFYVAGGMSTSADAIGPFTFYKGSTDYTTKVAIGTTTANSYYETGTLAGDATGTVVVTFDSEEVITADTSQTFYLKASVTGVGTVGENIQSYIMDDASYAAPNTYASTTAAAYFVWTDRHVPAINHSETSSDWDTGYLVATLSTETYTISK